MEEPKSVEELNSDYLSVVAEKLLNDNSVRVTHRGPCPNALAQT